MSIISLLNGLFAGDRRHAVSDRCAKDRNISLAGRAMLLLIVLALLLACLPALSLANPTNVTLSPDADSYVMLGSDINSGTVKTLSFGVESSHDVERAYAHYSLSSIPSTAYIRSATLYGHSSKNITYSVTRDLTVHRVTGTWNETGITWNTQPTFDPNASCVIGPIGSTEWFTFNVTRDVLAFVNGSTDNDGWVYKFDNESTPCSEIIYFGSRESTGNKGAYRPYLNISYYPDGVVPLPCGDFVVNRSVGSVPMSVQFYDQSQDELGWAWDFNGDGVVDSTLENPVYTYLSPGVYSVNLTVSNEAGSNSTVKAGFVSVTAAAQVPVAGFVSNVTNGVVPFSVQFNDTSVNAPASWVWDFGDGNVSTLQDPVHVYCMPGVYNVSLTV